MNYLQKLFHLGPNFDVHITIEKIEKNDKYRLPYFKDEIPIFVENDMYKGSIDIKFKENKQPIIHNGIDISIVGQFKNVNSNSGDQFYIRTTNLSSPGTINDDSTLYFDLEPIECQIPSYYGSCYDCHYFLEVKINSYAFSEPFYYLTFTEFPPRPQISESAEGNQNNLLSEIGIEGILKIRAIFKNFYFEVSDLIYGILYFETIRLKIVNCYFQIQRIETYQSTIFSSTQKFDVCKYQLLDGIPCRGDTIPIRVFMPSISAWPYPDTTANLKVKYIVRLLFVDVNGKTYHRKLGDFVYRCKRGPKEDDQKLEEQIQKDEQILEEKVQEEKEPESNKLSEDDI